MKTTTTNLIETSYNKLIIERNKLKNQIKWGGMDQTILNKLEMLEKEIEHNNNLWWAEMERWALVSC
jgi:hypothetical protein